MTYTVTASRTPTSYGSVSPSGAQTVYYDKSLTVTATPASNAYKLSYWALDGSNTGVSTSTYTLNNVIADHTLQAVFTTRTFTVTFDPNGGAFPYTNTTVDGITYGMTVISNATKTVTYGGTYGTLPTPSKANHTFQGWYTATTGGTKVTSNTTVALSDNQPLYARFTLNTYTVTFVPNDSAYGKVNNQSQIIVQNVPHGTTFATTENVFTLNTSPATTVTATPNEGYAFDMWGTNIGDTIVRDVTITAMFAEAHTMGTPTVPLENVSVTFETLKTEHYTDIYAFNGSSVNLMSTGVEGWQYDAINIDSNPSGNTGLSITINSHVTGTLSMVGDITVTYTYQEWSGGDVYPAETYTVVIHSIQGYTAELTVPSLPNAQATLSAPGYTSKTVTAGATQSLQVVSGTSVTYELVTTPTDYQFRGWGLSATATSYESTLATYSKVITQNAHLYAIFGGTSTLTVTLDVSPSGAGTIGRMIGQASQIVTVPVPYSLANVPYNSEITVTSGNILTIGNDFATFVASETGFQGWSVASGTRITANMAIYAYYSSSGYTQTLTLYLGRTYTNQTFTGANGARMKNADTYTVSNVTFTNR